VARGRQAGSSRHSTASRRSSTTRDSRGLPSSAKKSKLDTARGLELQKDLKRLLRSADDVGDMSKGQWVDEVAYTTNWYDKSHHDGKPWNLDRVNGRLRADVPADRKPGPAARGRADAPRQLLRVSRPSTTTSPFPGGTAALHCAQVPSSPLSVLSRFTRSGAVPSRRLARSYLVSRNEPLSC